MALQHVHTDNAPAAIGPYSQGTIVNGMLFTAGQIALDPVSGTMATGDVREQTELVMRNLTAVITAAGATWADVARTTVYLHDIDRKSVV